MTFAPNVRWTNQEIILWNYVSSNQDDNRDSVRELSKVDGMSLSNGI